MRPLTTETPRQVRVTVIRLAINGKPWIQRENFFSVDEEGAKKAIRMIDRPSYVPLYPRYARKGGKDTNRIDDRTGCEMQIKIEGPGADDFKRMLEQYLTDSCLIVRWDLHIESPPV